MAVNRIESAPTQGEAAPAAAEAAAPSPAAPSGFKSWLPLIITAIAMPALAFVMTQFVLLPQLKKGLGISSGVVAVKAKEPKAVADAKRETIPLNKLLVNVAGTMGARYLLVSLSVAGSNSEFKNKVQAHDPQLRDFACGVLATKTIADLEKPGSRNAIRSELLSGFNNILGGALVEEIYLTEFAIQ
ncbi:MAG TPA: flagellar basal body-associated FliL family protein [Patescibacteria group bacterium]|jgi:flagellar FliL protein|nr:flagellar basal body-associated FliL family protein [Patescibacteria group bacterium]